MNDNWPFILWQYKLEVQSRDMYITLYQSSNIEITSLEHRRKWTDQLQSKPSPKGPKWHHESAIQPSTVATPAYKPIKTIESIDYSEPFSSNSSSDRRPESRGLPYNVYASESEIEARIRWNRCKCRGLTRRAKTSSRVDGSEASTFPCRVSSRVQFLLRFSSSRTKLGLEGGRRAGVQNRGRRACENLPDESRDAPLISDRRDEDGSTRRCAVCALRGWMPSRGGLGDVAGYITLYLTSNFKLRFVNSESIL